jgi:hypothetical protein
MVQKSLEKNISQKNKILHQSSVSLSCDFKAAYLAREFDYSTCLRRQVPSQSLACAYTNDIVSVMVCVSVSVSESVSVSVSVSCVSLSLSLSLSFSLSAQKTVQSRARCEAED